MVLRRSGTGMIGHLDSLTWSTVELRKSSDGDKSKACRDTHDIAKLCLRIVELLLEVFALDRA